MRSVVAGASIAVALFAAGCGTKHAGGGGSIPIKTIAAPTRTETYNNPSSSMEPTLHCAGGQGCEAAQADRVVVQEPVNEIKRGDILLFNTPPEAAARCGAGGKFIKRLIGLPGETWSERNGYVYINGKKLNEPYIKPDRRDYETHSPQLIRKGTYFMMGDNRGESCDSRVWGTVPKVNLIGKVVQIERPG